MSFFAILLWIFGLWAVSWGLFACWRRPSPHDLLGMGIATLGMVAIGLGAAILMQPGFLA